MVSTHCYFELCIIIIYDIINIILVVVKYIFLFIFSN